MLSGEIAPKNNHYYYYYHYNYVCADNIPAEQLSIFISINKIANRLNIKSLQIGKTFN